jgi:hypothetical protein
MHYEHNPLTAEEAAAAVAHYWECYPGENVLYVGQDRQVHLAEGLDSAKLHAQTNGYHEPLKVDRPTAKAPKAPTANEPK